MALPFLLLGGYVGAKLKGAYNRKNATEREINDPTPGGKCGSLEVSAGKKWVPFKGGLLRRTDKCALCPTGTAAVALHRIGNNECVAGSDSSSTRQKRVKYMKQRSAGGGETRYYKLARDGTKTRIKQKAYAAGKERQAGCDMKKARKSKKSKNKKKKTRV